MNFEQTVHDVYFHGVTDVKSTNELLDQHFSPYTIKDYIAQDGYLNNTIAFFLAQCLNSRDQNIDLSFDLSLKEIRQKVIDIIFFDDNLNLVGNNIQLLNQLMKIDKPDLMEHYRNYYNNETLKGEFSTKPIFIFLISLINKVGEDKTYWDEIFETLITTPASYIQTKDEFKEFISHSTVLLAELARYYPDDVEFFVLDNFSFKVELSEYSTFQKDRLIRKLITKENADRFINRMLEQDSLGSCIDLLVEICDKGRVDLVEPLMDKIALSATKSKNYPYDYENYEYLVGKVNRCKLITSVISEN